MKRFIFLLLLIFFCAGVEKGLYLLKDGFTLRRICVSEFPPVYGETAWDEKNDSLLAQPFHYIGRGRQCFAFASADGKYVLKFLRTDLYKTPFWLRVLPLPSYRKKREARCSEKLAFILNSFQIAFHTLKEQTGVLAIHLGQKDRLKPLIVTDALGLKHIVPLDRTIFVLQYKYPLLMNAFLQAIDQREKQKMLDALVDVIWERGKKGILNRDRSFLPNYGFDGQKAYQIDIGCFFRAPELDIASACQKSARDSIDAIEAWLAENDPEMLAYLETKPIKKNH